MKKILNDELYDDYIVVEKLERKHGHQILKVKCKICGHEKLIADSNLLKQNNNHSALNCKKDFYNIFLGKTFGDYKCVEIINKNKEYKLKLVCQVCNSIKELSPCELKDNYKHSVMHCKENFFNYTLGKIYGDFKVLEIKEKKYSEAILICECLKCKTKIEQKSKNIINSNLTHGHICFKFLKDNEYKNIISTRFNDMKQRCTNPKNNNYVHYGARGIQLKYQFPIDLYYDFIDELKNHSKLYGIKNSSFDRIDVNGHYEKNNLRITTQQIQNINCTDRIFFILKKNEEKVICDSFMVFGKHFNINGRAIGNLVRGKSKSSFGWELVKKYKNLNKNELKKIIKQEGVTTNLIISL